MEYTITQGNQGSVVSLMGLINEDSEMTFQNIVHDIIDDKVVTFNFSGVKSINSLGVRAWVTFLRGIEQDKEVHFAECTPDVIMQVNMIPSFAGKAVIDSFYVNYVCDVCSKEIQKLINTQDIPPGDIPPTPKCETEDCGIQTEELEEEYFVFLNRRSGGS